MSDMVEYYNGIASGYDELYKEEQLKKFAILLADDELFVGADTMLDVGCGTGFSLDYFPVKKATGIDPADKLVEQYTGKQTILVGAAEDLPFEDHSFDVVISMTAIQNFEDIRKGLEEIRRVGKNRFGLSYLKRSSKAEKIEDLIDEIFSEFQILRIEEEKDFIFIIEE
ncbi:MAG: class I SAM-dependent methyltransferase [Nanoarchaeota archaeon]|nr:class I SAM-dependent methyltransferase [Nanoarchaeota archaeon]